jgi:hypothetical protein
MLRASGVLRALSVMTLVNTVGNGLLATAVVLYFTHVVGLSGGQVGVGLTIAGGLGLLVGVPLGHLADRRGPREVLVVLCAAEGVAVATYVLVGSFAGFLAAVCLTVTLDRGAAAVRQGLFARVLDPDARVSGRAFLRAVTNVGFALGAGVAAVAIALDTRAAYDALILGDALTFLAAALLLLRVPHVAPQPRDPDDDGPRLVVLRDRPFLIVTGLVAIMSLHFSLLEVGIPLWVQDHTAAPRVTVAIVFIVNCVLVALLSVRLARGSDTVPGAARAGARAGVILAASCVVFATASGATATVAAVIVVGAGIVEVLGEIVQAASGWGLEFGLAPEHAQGQYQGAAATGFALSLMLGPALMAAVTAAGTAGWLAFGALFLVAGFATVPVAAWAQAHRDAAAAAA